MTALKVHYRGSEVRVSAVYEDGFCGRDRPELLTTWLPFVTCGHCLKALRKEGRHATFEA